MAENKTVNDMTDSEIPEYPCTHCSNTLCAKEKATASKKCPKWAAWFTACWNFIRQKYGIDFK